MEIVERDPAAHRAVMRVKAKETRGQGTADATAVLQLSEQGGATVGEVGVNVALSGKAASMGQGAIQDVSSRLVGTFAGNLGQMLALTSSAPTVEGSAGAPAPGDAPAAAPPAVADAISGGDIVKAVVAGRLRSPRVAIGLAVATPGGRVPDRPAVGVVALVLLTPVGLDRDCWSWLDLPSGDVARHEFPGFGSRSRLSAAPDIVVLADEVAATYPGELDLVGVSMGGMVAQHLAIRHPDRVRSVVVACTGAYVDPLMMRRRAQASERGVTPEVLDDTLHRWFTDDVVAQGDAHPGRRLRQAHPARAGAWGVRGRVAVDRYARRSSRLHTVRARVTCIAAAQDAAASVERVSEIADAVPDGRLVVVDGPHMLHLEEPDVFSAVLAEHLRLVEEAAWPASR